MARPLRIEYPGAFYHITSRGNEQKAIYKSHRDREKSIAMEDNSNILEDWKFSVDEISVNVYRVRGVDKLGRSVERIGTDPDTVLEECKAEAQKID